MKKKVKNRQPDTRGVVFPQHKILPFFLILGPVAIVVLFFIYPTLSSLRLSLFTVGRFGQEVWIGLDNFASIFLENKYRNSLLLSILFSFAVTLIGLLLSLGIATLLTQRLKGIGAFRVFLTWTYAISPTIMATIWLLFMDPATGPLPYVVKEVTGLQVHWTTSSSVAFAVIILTAIWAKLGYNTLFFLVALRRVSEELIDAAKIDGASAWTTFWKIKFPLISPVTFFLLIMNTLFSLYWVFPIIDIMTHGGPGRSTSILIYTLFIEGFRNGRAGLASALSIVIFSFVAIITIVQFKFAGKKVFYK